MNAPLRIFIGRDKRQPLAANVLTHSLYSNASIPLTITQLCIDTLPVKRTGLTEFTYTRYLVPFLCDYKGWALFLDADMVVDADIADLLRCATFEHGVFVNTTLVPMEWPSAMLFNCERCTKLTPEYIEHATPQHLKEWAGSVGPMDPLWNYVVGYSPALPDGVKPKLIHYTAGIPIWPETRDSQYADVWRKYHAGMNASCTYNDLMANSVHHRKVVSGEIRGQEVK